jgi:hypothetical protein
MENSADHSYNPEAQGNAHDWSDLMKATSTVLVLMLVIAAEAAAVDFLGVELCKGSTATGVSLPAGSMLVLESEEIGDHGGLVLLVSARRGIVMEHVDDLMTGVIGSRGQGDADSLQWSNGRITALAQRVTKKYVALAVTSSEPCGGIPPAIDSRTAPPPSSPPLADTEAAAETAATSLAGAGSAAATTVVDSIEPMPVPDEDPPSAPPAEFESIGAISHEAADGIWVDVMGVVGNRSETSYRLATFDLSMYDGNGALICVDTISVSVLKTGQERAFRDAIRCSRYDSDLVQRIELQFAGGFSSD